MKILVFIFRPFFEREEGGLLNPEMLENLTQNRLFKHEDISLTATPKTSVEKCLHNVFFKIILSSSL